MAAIFTAPAFLFRPPHRPAIGQFSLLILRRDLRRQAFAQQFCGATHFAPHRHGDRMELAQLAFFEVDLDDGFGRFNPRMIGEGGAKRQDQIALIHEPGGDGRTRAPEDAGCIGVSVRNLALGLERGEHGRAQHFGQSDNLSHRIARAIAHNDDGAFCAVQPI